jgi:NADH dehydrogenase [ubiquinone] 1 alpha subcomplex assembly factor 6
MTKRALAPLSECGAIVREHDPDRYLATLFAPADARETLFALYAFDHELARVRQVVREPMAGMIRFQWWRDALAGIAAGTVLAHPVVAALHAAWPRLAPERPGLEAAIDAREFALTAPAPADLDALERRLAAACGKITAVAMASLGASPPAAAVARHLGLTLGLVRLIQAVPADLRHDRLRLPPALLARHGIDAAGGDGRGFAPVVAELAARARGHLQEARGRRQQVPRAALAALLHAPLLAHYLQRLARAGHDPFAQVATRPRPGALLELLGRRLLGRY